MPRRTSDQDSYRRIFPLAGIIAIGALLGVATPSHAQQPPTTGQAQPATPATSTPPTSDPAQADPKADPAAGASKDRIFGVLPNYTTVTKNTQVKPITNRDAFKMAALDSFDPFVYPLFGFVAAVNQAENQEPTLGRGWSGYGKRYGTAFADNTVCSIVTTGLMPSLLKQDPRYFLRGTGSVGSRLGYAASRSVVTRSRKGRPVFNLSEVGGTLVVASVSNLYYPAHDRTWSDTIVRWGTQAMWDTVATELKEFWPDIRRKLHGN
jgi:hypothetical protein